MHDHRDYREILKFPSSPVGWTTFLVIALYNASCVTSNNALDKYGAMMENTLLYCNILQKYIVFSNVLNEISAFYNVYFIKSGEMIHLTNLLRHFKGMLNSKLFSMCHAT